MKFEWKYRYVNEGQLEPDKHGRWAIECFIYAHIDKSLPEQSCWNELHDGYYPVCVARISLKKVENDLESVTAGHIRRYESCVPSFKFPNTGMSNEVYHYSDNIEELKKIVEKEFERTKSVFINCK